MKKILVAAFIIIAHQSFAQVNATSIWGAGAGLTRNIAAKAASRNAKSGNLNDLKFTIDTVLINGDKVPVQNIELSKLEKFKLYERTTDEKETAKAIETLQNSLAMCRKNVTMGRAISPDTIQQAHWSVTESRSHDYNLYIDGYIAELAYYDKIKAAADKIAAAEAAVRAAEAKRISDSTATAVKEQRLKEETERQIAQAKEDSISKIEQAKQARAYEAEVYRKFGKAMGNHILANEVVLGMSKSMCEYAWGYPEDINRTITSGMTSEQWVYGSGRYLYFRNGVLTSIQD